jgi:hypothetical protein
MEIAGAGYKRRLVEVHVCRERQQKKDWERRKVEGSVA